MSLSNLTSSRELDRIFNRMHLLVSGLDAEGPVISVAGW
jgi:hypothetical protein